MKARWWIPFCAMSLFALTGSPAHAQGHGHGHEDRDDRDGDFRARFDDHDREAIREWYDERDHGEGLPPGLAKRDQLPPGLEKQLVEHGEIPPGLRKKIRPVPEDLARRLPPPPPGCEHVFIGGHRTSIVVDIFHLELR